MVAGGFVSWFFLIPMIRFFRIRDSRRGDRGETIVPTTIGGWTDFGILWKQYIRYIEPGRVAGDSSTSFRHATIVHSSRSLRDMKKKDATAAREPVADQ